LRVFKVVKCPRCGHLQLTTARKSYRCFRCGATVELEERVVLFSSKDSSEAREILAKLKAGKR